MYPDDGIFLQGGNNSHLYAYTGDNSNGTTGSSNIWVHNNEFRYGSDRSGGDADQYKSDGATDIGDEATFVTISYNRYIECGKTMLVNGEKGRPFARLSIHNNWFDRTGSRHPRIRTGTAHVYNNVFTGTETSGIQAGDYSSIIGIIFKTFVICFT